MAVCHEPMKYRRNVLRRKELESFSSFRADCSAVKKNSTDHFSDMSSTSSSAATTAGQSNKAIFVDAEVGLVRLVDLPLLGLSV